MCRLDGLTPTFNSNFSYQIEDDAYYLCLRLRSPFSQPPHSFFSKDNHSDLNFQ